MIESDLVDLPPQHAGVPWPTLEWPTDAPGPEVDGATLESLVDRAMAAPDPDDLGETRAVVVVHRGRLVLERHAEGYGPAHTHPSWSLAKSILHAAVGIAVRDGLLEPAEPVDAPEWPPGDPRHAITVGDLLAMRCGLAWQEVYLPGVRSDVIDMLWGAGKDDLAAFVASKPLVAEPGSDESFVYSSGTSNLLARLLGDRIVSAAGGPRGAADEPTGAARAALVFEWLREQLLDPIGMTSAVPKADPAGTWVASSYCFATAADMARFGLFALRGGTWNGRELLPPGWMDRARTPRSVDVDTAPDRHGEHWWTSGSTPGAFFGSGYEGQRIWVAPAQDLVVVRLGVTDVALRPNLQRWLDDLTACFPTIDPARPPRVSI